MPYPGPGFPQPFQKWPHVGRQWPAYNVESDQAEGLLAWWPTLAGYRNLLPGLVSGFTGTLQADAAYITDTVMGSAIDLDGTGDYVSIDPGPAITLSEWTITAWVDLADYDFDLMNYLVCPTIGGVTTAGLFAGGTYNPGAGAHALGFYDGANLAHTAGGVISAADEGVWRLIICSYKDSRSIETEFFKDGLRIATDTDDLNGAFQFQSPWRFGYRLNDQFDLPGKLGGIRFYDRAFTEANAWQLYDPATRWELLQIPRRLWRLGAIAPPPPTAALPIFPPPDAIHSLVFGGVTVR